MQPATGNRQQATGMGDEIFFFYNIFLALQLYETEY